MDWTLLQSFLAVAESGSLSKAGKRLSLSQPTVGRHIQTLEEQLGTPLIVRHSRGIALTEHGRSLRLQAQGVEAQIAALLRRQAGHAEQVRGTVRLSVNEPIGLYVLPPWLAETRRALPHIHLEVVIENTVADLARRAADIAIRMFRPTQGSLVAKRVATLPLGLFAHRDYLAEYGEPRTLVDLPKHTFFGFDADPSWPKQLAAMQLSREQFALRTDSLALHMQSLLAGVGVGGLHLAMGHKFPQLVRILTEVKLPPLELWLAVPEDVRHDPAVAAIFESLVPFLERYAAGSTGPE